MVYIYALMDPVLNVPRYVGKSVKPEGRLKEHLYESRTCKVNSHRCNWIRKLLAGELQPVLKILQKIPDGYDETWQEAEKKWIKLFRLVGYPLTNVSVGGEGEGGFTHPKESWPIERRVRLRDRMFGNTIRRGSTMPDDSKRRIGVASQRFWDEVEEGLHPHPTKGKKNLGTSKAGKRRVGEKRSYHSRAMKGNQFGKGNTGKKHSIEENQNVSKGRRFSILRKQGIIPDLVDFATNVFNLEPTTKQGWTRFVQLHVT